MSHLVAPWSLSALVLFALVGLASAPASADLTTAQQEQHLRSHLANSPGDLEARVALVDLLLLDRRPADALSEVTLAEALRPGEPEHAFLRARALAALARPEEAASLLEEMERAAPDRLGGRYWSLRGDVHTTLGDHAQAASDYERAVDLGSTIALCESLARALSRSGQPEAAMRSLQQGIERHAGASTLRLELVRVARQQDRPRDALAQIDALLARTPRSARWRVLRAEILTELARPDEARQELARALSDAERTLRLRRSAMAYLERGRVRLAMGDRDGAVQDLTRATQRAPRLTEAADLLGRARR